MGKWRVLAALMAMLTALNLVAACASGRPVTRTEDFSNFTRLDVQNAFDLEVVQSASFGVTITASENLLDYLSVSQNGETLTIRLSPNHPFTDFILIKKTLKAKVSMPAIRGLSLSGASQGKVSGFESTDNLDLSVSGASSVRMNNIEVGNGDFLISGASRLSGKLTAADVKLDVSGASQVELIGSADDVTSIVSGASRLNLEEWVHKTGNVNLSGASQATVDAREKLDFVLSGASRLFFLSNPKTGTVEVTGASTVKHK